VNTALIDIDGKALEGLIQRVTEAREYGLALSPEDNQLLLDALLTLTHVQESLSSKDITLHKLRKLLGMVRSSEKLSDLLNTDTPRKSRKSGGKSASLRRKPSATRVKPDVRHHPLEDHTKGDPCPECPKGKLNRYDPARLLRITGQSPFVPVEHLSERLRCSACGIYLTATLPDEVKVDGHADQKYGYSARTLMALNKYFAGSPFYRQESLQNVLGVSVTASTVYDQCEYLSNDVVPVFRELQRLAADARHYCLDDTGNRITGQAPVLKKKRGSQKEHIRTGIYSSGLIATLDDHRDIVLLNTSIGHAGEFIDEVLRGRSPGRAPPILMSDALPSNNPMVIADAIRSFCNAHARRQFVDILSHFPEQVEDVMVRYARIWENETEAISNALSASERLVWHREKSLPVMADIRTWGMGLLRTGEVEENSALGKAIRYFDRHYDGLTRFCTTEGARLDNNRMEAMLKLVVRNRKNAMFFKTGVGAAVADVITSVIATSAEAGVNVFGYFNALQRHATLVKNSPGNWLPWNYEKQLQA